jgi:hypothetical protein
VEERVESVDVCRPAYCPITQLFVFYIHPAPQKYPVPVPAPQFTPSIIRGREGKSVDVCRPAYCPITQLFCILYSSGSTKISSSGSGSAIYAFYYTWEGREEC